MSVDDVFAKPPGSSEPLPESGSQALPHAEFARQSLREGTTGDHSRAALLPFPVVGLGVSLDALEPCQLLLHELAPDTGMAFVLVAHCESDGRQDLRELLSLHTRMPVDTIVDGLRPEPNHLYVLPGGHRLSFAAGVLRLEPCPPGQHARMTIDHFFRLLAADQKNHAIGVLISGSGSDGALGLAAIKGEGGIAIAVAADGLGSLNSSAAAILEDRADLFLTPPEIGWELGRIAARFFAPELGVLAQGDSPDDGDDAAFSRILTLLRSVSDIEFHLYKPGTLRRRTARRMILNQMSSLDDYTRLLQQNPDEIRHLQEDILIGVTRFFRDPDVFETLKSEILPRLFSRRPADQQVRIWVPGCSTGEEAYSIAICLLEYLSNSPSDPPVQIFGTDASEQSIRQARTARYPESIASDVSPERLRRYFVRTEQGYRVSKRVRDLCIFARQDVCHDPPFSRLDLISCRNLLIYLGQDAQHRILSTFYYALRPNGQLLLGTAESIREHDSLFVPADRKYKAYVRTDSGKARVPNLEFPWPAHENLAPQLPSSVRNHSYEPELLAAADRIVLARFAPPGVVINERMEVLQVRGDTAPYLHMTPGTASLRLSRMLREGFGSGLRDGIRRAITEDVPVIVDQLSVQQRGEVHRFSAEILPIPPVASRPRTFLVVFLPARRNSFEVAELLDQPVDISPEELGREVAKLRQDLTSTRLYMQSLIEEREAHTQELTSAYEELQSANEELQSINEELETAKEELQSSNEELQTLNEELRLRNTALLSTGNDLSNLLNSVNIPVVMLGQDLTIRQFTPPAERLLCIRPQDIGRPLSEIRLNIAVDALEPLLHNVLDTLGVSEREVQDREGRWHLLRIRPYRTRDNKIDGLVIVLLDIDQLRRGEESMREARDLSQSVVEAVPTAFVVLGADLRVRSANMAFRDLAALTFEDLENRSFPELTHLLWEVHDLRSKLEKIRDAGGTLSFEVEHAVPGNVDRILRFAARRVQNERSACILVLVEDISREKNTERALREERDYLSGEVHMTSQALESSRSELRALAGRLFTSQEEERRRVARELHDDLGQKLAALYIDAEQLQQRVGVDPEGASRSVLSLRDRLSSLSHDIRSLSHRLHPSALEDLGLASALRSLVQEFGDHEGMPATFRSRNVPEQIPLETAGALYRITQEALRNVVKHAGHTHVKVSLDGMAGRLRLTIRDFGEGFDMSESGERGLGLISMQERAHLAGGELVLQSELGEGTVVTATVPIADA